MASKIELTLYIHVHVIANKNDPLTKYGTKYVGTLWHKILVYRHNMEQYN